MTLRVAINGYGRIGRNLLRAFYEDAANCECAGGHKAHNFEIVAINDVGSAESLLHLTRYDTTHGAFRGDITLVEQAGQEYLAVNSGAQGGGDQSGDYQSADSRVAVYHHASPADCPWAELNIDVVLECTGLFRAKAEAAQHLQAGAKAVVIGAVSFDEVDNTIVYGVNHESYSADQHIISNASCTTHCIAPLLKMFDQQWGIKEVLMTEIHPYTSDQSLLDKTHRDLRRARAGAQNLIPTTSSSIGAVQKVLPQLQGKIDGYSMRVPTINVAAVDLTLRFETPCTVEDINALVSQQAAEQWQGIVGYCAEPLVSSDFIHRAESAIFDATQTKALGELCKITAWYDNEWGYTQRLIDLLDFMAMQ
ncbi:MAG: erythrose-4-phosphate dehydrogenase [Gammaproteobacteria bacterium]|nr:MAG: erythrose-4-phosphate dehydrogenase [Gammaproteobacteria bacterium]